MLAAAAGKSPRKKKKKMIAGSGHLRPSSCDVARGGQEEKTNRFRKSSLAVYRANADGRRLMAG